MPWTDETSPLNVHHAVARTEVESSSAYDLTRLSLLGRTVIHLKENYVDPGRIDESKMLVEALQFVQSEVDDVVVTSHGGDTDEQKTVLVRAGSEQKRFQLDEIDNLWQLSFRLKDVFKFIQTHSRLIHRPKYVEYAAINGILSTLDPHSALLDPNEYREMKLSTNGRFGGLGIVIQMEDGYPVVVRPIPNTPAERAGLKAGDKIVQIGLDSTISMTTDETVDLLRGEPDTPAVIWVARKSWSSPRKFVVPRAEIAVDSVNHWLLPGGVGVIRIDQFQSSTHAELVRAHRKLKRLAKGRLVGLVLDLRGNPGGLLEQAVRVADRFVASGPLVTTVGYGAKVRQPKMATRDGTEKNLPIVVLVDETSASASEIVAGALKNHNRALIVGQRTFGKGSVQVIYDNQDDSALKLTIAQYLTPGDESIQSVGIIPDIRVQPLRVDSDNIDLDVQAVAGEGQLPRHLTSLGADTSTKPALPTYTIPYLRDLKAEEAAARQTSRLVEDFETKLAADILRNVKSYDRAVMLKQVEPLIQSQRRLARDEIKSRLAQLQVDWSDALADENRPTSTEVEMITNLRDGVISPGETLKLTVRVHNRGSGTLTRLTAATSSNFPLLDDREFVFGRLGPGQSRSWSIDFKIDPAMPPARLSARLQFRADQTTVPSPQMLTVRVSPTLRPRFGFDYQIDDRRFGNGDGMLQSGEEAELRVRVFNEGQAVAHALLGVLRPKREDHRPALTIQRGRIELSPLSPGEAATFNFRIKAKELQPGSSTLRVLLSDVKSGETTSGDIPIVIVQKSRRLLPDTVYLTPISGPVCVFGHYDATSGCIGTISGQFRARAGTAGWYRVVTPTGSFGWLKREDVRAGEAGDMTFQASRPARSLNIVLSSNGTLESPQETFDIRGYVQSHESLRDIRVFNNDRKVFYKSVDDTQTRRQPFEVGVPLTEGLNRLEIVGRTQGGLTRTHRLIVVRPKA